MSGQRDEMAAVPGRDQLIALLDRISGRTLSEKADAILAAGFGPVRAVEAEAEIRGQMRHITAEMVRGDQPLEVKEELIADLRAQLSHVEAARDDAHEKGYWVGYREGKDEAETRDLNYDETTARAESAEAALAGLRAGVEALADMYDNRIRDRATRLAPDAVAARLRSLLAATPDREEES